MDQLPRVCMNLWMDIMKGRTWRRGPSETTV